MTTGDVQFDYEKEKNVFEQTFKFINDNWGGEVFSGKTTNGNMKNEFVLYYFDGIAVSLASLIERIILSDRSKEVVECVDGIKYGTELQSYKTGSVNRVKSRIKLFTEGVEKVLDGR